jgi:quercetin dioxygenase-like cupin family protein
VQAFEAGEPYSLADELCRGGVTTWEPGRSCPVHLHEGAMEWFVFLRGACDFEVEGEVRRLGEGESVHVRPGELHRLTAVGDEPLVMFLVVAPNREPSTTYFKSDGTPVHWEHGGRRHPDTQEEVDAS